MSLQNRVPQSFGLRVYASMDGSIHTDRGPLQIRTFTHAVIHRFGVPQILISNKTHCEVTKYTGGHEPYAFQKYKDVSLTQNLAPHLNQNTNAQLRPHSFAPALTPVLGAYAALVVVVVVVVCVCVACSPRAPTWGSFPPPHMHSHRSIWASTPTSTRS